MSLPRVVAFDALETSLSLAPLKAVLRAAGLRRSQMDLWLSNTLRDGFAVQTSGIFRPFLEVLLGSLTALLAEQELSLTPRARIDAVYALERLRPQRDFRRALRLLEAAGIPAVILTNAASSSTEQSLENAGLNGSIAHVFTVEDVRHYKPAHQPYLQIPESMQVAPREVLYLTCHAWDAHGAVAAGLRAAFIPRGHRYSPMFDPPEFFADSLDAAVAAALRDDALLQIGPLDGPGLV